MPATDDQIVLRRERAAGRILDDERLRGALDDATFEPIQAWLLAWVDAYAAGSAGLDDGEADALVDGGIAWAKAVVEPVIGVLGDWPAAPAAVETACAQTAARGPAPGAWAIAPRLTAVADASEAARRLVATLPHAPAVP